MPYIVPNKPPKTCLDCPFRSEPQEFSVEIGFYKKISRCTIAPKEIVDNDKDVYRDEIWQYANKEEWCPLKEVKGE